LGNGDTNVLFDHEAARPTFTLAGEDDDGPLEGPFNGHAVEPSRRDLALVAESKIGRCHATTELDEDRDRFSDLDGLWCESDRDDEGEHSHHDDSSGAPKRRDEATEGILHPLFVSGTERRCNCLMNLIEFGVQLLA
jgi:hypothetical protein